MLAKVNGVLLILQEKGKSYEGRFAMNKANIVCLLHGYVASLNRFIYFLSYIRIFTILNINN